MNCWFCPKPADLVMVATRRGPKRVCAACFVRWSVAGAELAAERNEVAVRIAIRIERLAARIRGSVAAGIKPKPGTVKAILRMNDHRRGPRVPT